MAQRSPAEVLFSTYHRRILALLLLRPEQSFYVREIARLAEVPAGSLHRELKFLAESGLLLREPAGNQVRYRANRDCPVFTELAGVFRKTVGLADGLGAGQAGERESTNAGFPKRLVGAAAQDEELIMGNQDTLVIGQVLVVPRNALQELAQRYHIRRLALFGSAARGELRPDSDIDLLVEFESGEAPSLGGMVEIQESFEKLFGGRKVDVATPSILNNPYRRRAIEKDMEELYAA